MGILSNVSFSYILFEFADIKNEDIDILISVLDFNNKKVIDFVEFMKLMGNLDNIYDL